MHVTITLDVCYRAECLTAGRYLSGRDLSLHQSQPAPPDLESPCHLKAFFIPASPTHQVVPSCQDVPYKTRPLKTQVYIYLDMLVLAGYIHFFAHVSIESLEAHLVMTNPDTLLVES